MRAVWTCGRSTQTGTRLAKQVVQSLLDFSRQACRFADNRNFIVTASGFVGITPAETQQDDIIVEEALIKQSAGS
jgi:hypothetical protein